MNNLRVINRTTAVVTELPQQPVLSQFHMITGELLRAKFKGKVFFDLLVSKGIDSRFVEAEFDGNTIVRSTLKNTLTSDIPKKLVETQSDFFSKNTNLLKASILNRQDIQRFFHQ
jgi:hypothetical protein